MEKNNVTSINNNNNNNIGLAMNAVANAKVFKNRKSFISTYADLNSLLEVINKNLAKHGFFVTQLVNTKGIKTDIRGCNGDVVLSSGYLEVNDKMMALSGNKTNALQNLGSQFTYLKRYQIQALFAINIENDTDGVLAKNAADAKSRQQKTPPQNGNANTNYKQQTPPQNGNVDATDW